MSVHLVLFLSPSVNSIGTLEEKDNKCMEGERTQNSILNACILEQLFLSSYSDILTSRLEGNSPYFQTPEALMHR